MSIRPALSKLHHKDVRQRRRAVRHLFEIDDPDALSGFILLLDDDDPWFREKSMEAIERWAVSADLKIFEKLSRSSNNEKRLLAARISGRAQKSGALILKKLTTDRESNIRLAAWKSLIKIDQEEIPNALLCEDKAVRKEATYIIMDNKELIDIYIHKILNDDAESVRSAGIHILTKNLDLLDNKKILQIIGPISKIKNPRDKAKIAGLMIQEAFNDETMASEMITLTKENNSEFIDVFSKKIRETDWSSIPGFKNSIIESANDSLTARILFGVKKTEEVKIRDQILKSKTRSESLKSRLIEDLIGRDVAESTKEIILQLSESEDEMVSQSAINLMRELS